MESEEHKAKVQKVLDEVYAKWAKEEEAGKFRAPTLSDIGDIWRINGVMHPRINKILFIMYVPLALVLGTVSILDIVSHGIKNVWHYLVRDHVSYYDNLGGIKPAPEKCSKCSARERDDKLHET